MGRRALRDLEGHEPRPRLRDDGRGRDVFKKYIERRMAMPFFSNARTVRNAMDRARMNAAIRVFGQAISGANSGDVGAEDLKAITADDFQVILDEALAAEDDAILAWTLLHIDRVCIGAGGFGVP